MTNEELGKYSSTKSNRIYHSTKNDSLTTMTDRERNYLGLGLSVILIKLHTPKEGVLSLKGESEELEAGPAGFVLYRCKFVIAWTVCAV